MESVRTDRVCEGENDERHKHWPSKHEMNRIRWWWWRIARDIWWHNIWFRREKLSLALSHQNLHNFLYFFFRHSSLHCVRITLIAHRFHIFPIESTGKLRHRQLGWDWMKKDDGDKSRFDWNFNEIRIEFKFQIFSNPPNSPIIIPFCARSGSKCSNVRHGDKKFKFHTEKNSSAGQVVRSDIVANVIQLKSICRLFVCLLVYSIRIESTHIRLWLNPIMEFYSSMTHTCK